jgi:hypothetical protein
VVAVSFNDTLTEQFEIEIANCPPEADTSGIKFPKSALCIRRSPIWNILLN